MLRTARSRYTAAAALWSCALAWIALRPEGGDVRALLLSAAVTATVCAAVAERDERVREIIRLSWWAGTAAAPSPPRFPRQGSVPAWPGVDREAQGPAI